MSVDPRDKRLRVSALVQWENYTYIIDCGPDFRQQMLTHRVKRIDGILFTHEHADHTMGLDDIRPFFFQQGAIPIYAHPRVLQLLRQQFYYIFTDTDRYPGVPAVAEYPLENGVPVQLGNKTVIPISASHNQLQVFGFRLDDFAYFTDVKTMGEKEMEKLANLKILVINALRIEPHPAHFNLEEALRFIEKIQPEQAYLTHISHLLGFHAEVEKQLPFNVRLAHDNLTLTI
jgi:phosphoribosyl 1,2-cyclic phosphate phosphodiesterase